MRPQILPRGRLLRRLSVRCLLITARDVEEHGYIEIKKQVPTVERREEEVGMQGRYHDRTNKKAGNPQAMLDDPKEANPHRVAERKAKMGRGEALTHPSLQRKYLDLLGGTRRRVHQKVILLKLAGKQTVPTKIVGKA